MEEETTNPDLPTLKHIFGEVRGMRKENKKEHETITDKLNTHSIQLACLETKWKFLKWLIPATVGLIGAVVTISSLV